MKNYCENCKWYYYKSNILGGITECIKEIKPLNTFWKNEACENFENKKQTKESNTEKIKQGERLQ